MLTNKIMREEYGKMYEVVRSNYTEEELLRLNSKPETARQLSAADKDYLKEIAERKRKENLAKKNFNKKKKKK